MIEKNLLGQLRTILKEDFKKDLPDKAVFEIATTLLGTFELLTKQDNETNHKKGS